MNIIKKTGQIQRKICFPQSFLIAGNDLGIKGWKLSVSEKTDLFVPLLNQVMHGGIGSQMLIRFDCVQRRVLRMVVCNYERDPQAVQL